MSGNRPESRGQRLDRIVAEARRAREERERSYRERALKLFPWVCARCGRAFGRENVRELTVHHKDHDHDHNPPDGSNWELLCLYCHDNEHQRLLQGSVGLEPGAKPRDGKASNRPFAELEALLKGRRAED